MNIAKTEENNLKSFYMTINYTQLQMLCKNKIIYFLLPDKN